MRTAALLAIVLAGPALGQSPSDKPVALITRGGGSLQKAGRATLLSIRTGDLLYPGDRIEASSPLTIWHCPAKQIWTVEGGAKLSVTGGSLRVEAGNARTDAAAPFCPVPSVTRG